MRRQLDIGRHKESWSYGIVDMVDKYGSERRVPLVVGT